MFVSGGIDGPKHASILADTLLSVNDAAYKGMTRFRQDNASSHTSKHNKEFFIEETVTVMESKSPGLNPIESLYAILALDVYAQWKQYYDLEELKQTIRDEWEKSQRKCC